MAEDYDAFLSYSHADAAAAEGIQRGLHRIGRRVGRLHALRVFRDATDLVANPDLWGKVREAMDASRFLVVLLSPQAAASQWVSREVDYWLAHRGPEQIIFALVEGTLVWDEPTRRFDPQASDAALPMLTETGTLTAEPLFVDLSADAPWDLADPGFRDRLTDLAAPIHGKPKYQLAGEDLREQRRFRRLRRAAVAALTVLTVAATVAALMAVASQRRADHNMRIAVARKLTAEAQGMLAGTLPGSDFRAFQQILAADSLDPAVARPALHNALQRRADTEKVIYCRCSAVNAVAVSPDARRIVSGDSMGQVQIWDTETGTPVGDPIAVHANAIGSVAFSPDGRRVASSGADGTVRIVEVESGEPVTEPMTVADTQIIALAFSPDGLRLATGDSGGMLRLWDSSSGSMIREVRAEDRVLRSVVYSPSGDRIAAAGGEGIIRIWDADLTGTPIVANPHTRQAVMALAFDPGGGRLAGAGIDGTLRLWDADTGNPIGEPMTAGPELLMTVAFSPDGESLAAAGDDHRIHRWDARTRKPLGQPMTGHTATVRALTYTRDGRLVSGSDDATIRIWDPRATAPMITTETTLSALAISPDGHRLASGAGDGRVQMWDPADGHRLAPVPAGHGKEVGKVAFSPDGRRIASASFDGTVAITDLDGSPPARIPAQPAGDIWAVAFSPDGRRLAIGVAGGRIGIWELTGTPKPLREFTAHPGTVTALAFSPDGALLASTGFDGSVRLWESDSSRPAGEPLIGPYSQQNSLAVAFSPDGRTVAVAGTNGFVQTWDVQTRESGATFGRTGPIWSIVYSPDGALLASGGSDRGVRVWDVATATALMDPLLGHRDRVSTVLFTPDGRRLLSASDDGTVRAWPMTATPGSLCDKLTLNMSHQQWEEWVSPQVDYRPGCPDLPVP